MKALFVFFLFCVSVGAQKKEDVESTDAVPVSWWEFKTNPYSDQNKACRDLEPGKSRGVNEPQESSPTTIIRKFRVTKDNTDPKLYHVEIPLNFRDPLVPDGGEESYLQFANSCLKKYEDSLQDPDGNRLNLKIVKQGKDPATAAGKVTVFPYMERATKETWASKMSCETVVHESLHWTGLVDAYPEKETITYKVGWPGYSYRQAQKYNCRHIFESVMNNHQKALSPSYQVRICASSDNTSPYMTRVVDHIPECDKGERSRQVADLTSEENLASWISEMKNKNGFSLVYRRIPPPKAKLTRGEMQAIIKPHCTRDNDYFSCSKNAYLTRETDGCVKTKCNPKGE